MKYTVKFTTRFKKDLKLVKKQGRDIDELFRVVELLANGKPLASGTVNIEQGFRKRSNVARPLTTEV